MYDCTSLSPSTMSLPACPCSHLLSLSHTHSHIALHTHPHITSTLSQHCRTCFGNMRKKATERNVFLFSTFEFLNPLSSFGQLVLVLYSVLITSTLMSTILLCLTVFNWRLNELTQAVTVVVAIHWIVILFI